MEEVRARIFIGDEFELRPDPTRVERVQGSASVRLRLMRTEHTECMKH